MSDLMVPSFDTKPGPDARPPQRRVKRSLMTEIAEGLKAKPGEWGTVLVTDDENEARKRARLITHSKAAAFAGRTFETLIEDTDLGFVLFARVQETQ